MKYYWFALLIFLSGELYAAEAGMPQLDPKYWASQTFWLILVFTILYFTLSKIFIPKIKENLDIREKKISKDLSEAKKMRELGEKKIKDYQTIIENGKKEVNSFLSSQKKKMEEEILKKKQILEKELIKRQNLVEKELKELEVKSKDDVEKISEELTETLIGLVVKKKPNKVKITELVKRREKYLS